MYNLHGINNKRGTNGRFQFECCNKFKNIWSNYQLWSQNIADKGASPIELM